LCADLVVAVRRVVSVEVTAPVVMRSTKTTEKSGVAAVATDEIDAAGLVAVEVESGGVTAAVAKNEKSGVKKTRRRKCKFVKHSKSEFIEIMQ
jgi:hypothetical protein